MADMELQVEGQLNKRKGTLLLAVMDENCSSCALVRGIHKVIEVFG